MQNISHFIEGFQRFQNKYFSGEKTLYNALNNGQKPTTLLIGCCDSRVDPALLLDCDPGDIFVVSNGALLGYSERSGTFLPMVCPLGIPHKNG